MNPSLIHITSSHVPYKSKVRYAPYPYLTRTSPLATNIGYPFMNKEEKLPKTILKSRLTV